MLGRSGISPKPPSPTSTPAGSTLQIRGDNPKLCVLVIVGVDDSGRKHLVALEDGVRESTQSWRGMLLNLQSRGMKAPALADWGWGS